VPETPGQTRKRVLLIEDEAAIRSVVVEILRREGFDVVEAATGQQGIKTASQREPDLVLLDWVLPDISGLDVCREIRRQGVLVPIVMLTGRSTKVDVVVGLEVGADDYLTKPFDARELSARVRAHLRRAEGQPASSRREGVLTVGGVQIDTESRRVRIDDEEIQLTMTEFNLLALLAANAGRVLTRAQLLEKVWGYLADVDYHSVDPHMQRLRRKLNGHPGARVSLEAVPGLGYRLTPLN
jgi:two-component system response regulator RegX3